MNFIKDESGQGLTEYAFVLMLVAVFIFAVLKNLGSNVPHHYELVRDVLAK